MAASRGSPSGRDEDPFVRVLEWVITGFGYEELLLRLEQLKKLDGETVDRRTLDDWRRGGYPRQKRSSKVEILDKLARDLPDYPPPRGQGKSLVETSGPFALPVAGGVEPAASEEGAPPSSAGEGRSRWTVPWPALVALIVVVFVAGALLGHVVDGAGGGSARGNPPKSSPSATPEPTLPARTGLVVEVAAGRDDKEVPVFASPRGDAIPANVTARIPYATPVYVKCRAPNMTGGMRSVAGFYLIVGGTWDGLYAVSNGFTNGDPLGTQGGHNLDVSIPVCPTKP